MIKKVSKDNKGFTLTEVMIGIMILTVAIVAASNMLVTLLRSNEVNLTSMQAHYFAVEGLEAVRSIRDTNWLHNQDLRGTNWGYALGMGGEEVSLSLLLNDEGWKSSPDNTITDIVGLSSYFPWNLNATELITKCGDGFSGVYFGDCSDPSENTQFKRTINIEDYDCNAGIVTGCDPANSILVTSTVSWNIGADDRELSLSTVLTDWKGGAF